MKILHFSTYDITGGAAKAAYRQHMALRDAGHFSKMIVRYKRSRDKDVRRAGPLFNFRPVFNRIKNKIRFLGENFPKAPFMMNYDMNQGIDTEFFYDENPDSVDIISLYWITDFLTVKAIREIYEYYRRPLVWTLLDMEPVTGGCHYSYGCRNFTRQCENCHLLKTTSLKNWPQVVWRRKYEYLKGLPITFVAPTTWVAERIRESSIFSGHRVDIIPLAIDIKVFKPGDKNTSRRLLGIPEDKKVIFFGAYSLADPRKGMMYLRDALQKLVSDVSNEDSLLNQKDIFLLIAGSEDTDMLRSLPFTSKRLGIIKDNNTLVLAYQASDIFVSPSIEDAGPMMIPEAMLCGTPVAAFNTGGAPDLIETMKTGYLAAYKNSQDLARGIYSVLTADNTQDIKDAAYEMALSRHSSSVTAGRYLELYKEIKRQAGE